VSVVLLTLILSVPAASIAGPAIHPVSLRSAEENEQQAARALSNAKDVLKMARDLDDAESAAVAAEAVHLAQEVLERAAENTRTLRAVIRGIRHRRPGPGTGVVSDMRGDVYIRTGLGDISMRGDFILEQGDEIVTGADARMSFSLEGGSEITLGPESVFTATQMREDFSFSLAVGRLKAWVKNLGRRRFNIRSPHAICGVRGTEFEVEAGASGTTVTVYSGVVETKPEHGRAVMVRAGWRFRVGPDGRGSLETVGGVSLLTPGPSTVQVKAAL